MSKRSYKNHRVKAVQTRRKLALKRLKETNMPQAAIQRFTDGSQTPEDLLVLQETLGNEVVTNLLAQEGQTSSSESAGAPTVQRQHEMDEEDNMAAVDGPDKKEESGGLWGELKKAWAWFDKSVLGGGESESDQTTTPESGSEPVDTPQEGVEHPEETGEWTEEIMQ